MKTIAIALVVCSGCLFVPKTKTTARPAGVRFGDVIEGADRALELYARAGDGEIFVHAKRTRDCKQQFVAVTELTHSKELVYSQPDDPRAGAFGFLLSPVTLPVSLIVSGLMVVTSGDSKETTQRVVREQAQTCAHDAADLAVEITLPSGSTLHETTDASGNIRMHAPDGEPYTGTLIAHAETVTTQVAFSRPKPAISAVRDAVLACASKHEVTGRIDLRLTIDDEGLPVNVQLGAVGSPFAACVSSAIAPLRFPSHRGLTLDFPLVAPPA